MTYEEFKRKQDKEMIDSRRELCARADNAYNRGLWDAVKWNPFKWWVFAMFCKKPNAGIQPIRA